MMLDDLRGKRVLVTGSSSGIGAETAVAFAAHGASVAVHYHEQRRSAEEVAGRIEAAGSTAVIVQGDVRAPDEAAAMVEQAVAGLGGLDVLVNNAGGTAGQALCADYEDDELTQLFDLNVRSVMAATRAAHPHLRASGRASVIHTSSIAARVGGARRGSAIYAGTKAFVNSLTRSMAREFAADGIRVNTVAPGLMVTRLHDRTPQAHLDSVKVTVPLGRLGTAGDCVGAYLFFASEAMSGYATGIVLDVNGGRLMP